MANSSSDDQIPLKDLFIDFRQESRESHIRLESKVDEIKDKLDVKLADHDKKIERLTHTFSMIGWAVTSAGVLAGVASAVWAMVVRH